MEREHFYRPFHGSETEGAFRKYSHFLPRTAAALEVGRAGGRPPFEHRTPGSLSGTE